MNEVSTDTAALLLDAIEQRGGDAEALWAGLPVTRALLHTPGRRIDWELWVEMMARVAASPVPFHTPTIHSIAGESS